MFAITSKQMIERNMANARKLLDMLEQRVAQLESSDGVDTGHIDYYSFAIEKVKSDFAACGWPVNDAYDNEPESREQTLIYDEINDPHYGRLKMEILHLSDDDDVYLDDLKKFCELLKIAIEQQSGYPIAELAYHAEIRRRIAAKVWVVVLTWPAARLLGAINVQDHRHRIEIDTSLEELSTLTRDQVRARYSDEHLLGKLRQIRHDLSKAKSVIEGSPYYQRISFLSHLGIISLNWAAQQSHHYKNKTVIKLLPQSITHSLPGRSIDEVVHHPLSQNLGLKVIAAENLERGTEIRSDEREEANLIILCEPFV